MFSRDQLKRAASLTEEDFVQLGRCRRPNNRLGFAYQVAFVRLLGRFPQQQPFELFEELVCFRAAQLGLDAGLIDFNPMIGEVPVDLSYVRLHNLSALKVVGIDLFSSLMADLQAVFQQLAGVGIQGRTKGLRAERRKVDPFSIIAGTKAGLSVAVSLLDVEWLHPPGSTFVPSGAWLVIIVTTIGTPTGDLRLFAALFRTAIYGALITLGMFFLASAISNYWVMNLVVFAVLFPAGFATGRKVSFPFWIGAVLLLVSGIIGLNAHIPVNSPLIIESYLGVMTGLTIGVVVSRLCWPRLPQKVTHRKLVGYFRAAERVLRETSSGRAEQLSTEITLTPMEALPYVRVMGVDRRLRTEQTKVMALLPVLVSLSVDLNSLVTLKMNVPVRSVDVVLRPSFDGMDESFRRLLTLFREFLEMGRLRSQQAPATKMAEVLTRVSRYLATAEAFAECTALISTLDREEFTSDNVL